MKFFATGFLYVFSFITLIRSFPSLLVAPNYSWIFKLNILFLELFFFIKAILLLLFNKNVKSESFFGYKVVFPSYADFLCLFLEVFGIQEYRYITAKKSPMIIDCGSNWGMSVIYFKHFYPDAHIIGIEANKKTVAYLKKNIKLNNFKDIVIYPSLLAEKQEMHSFFINNKEDGWSLSDTGIADFAASRKDFSQVKVPTIQLSKLLRKKIDLLKLDIEGMEGEVLYESRKKLSNVKEIIMEYHGGIPGKRNKLSEIKQLLRKSGFSYSFSRNKDLRPLKGDNGLRIIHAINTINKNGK